MMQTVTLLSQPGLYESIKQADLEIREGDTLNLDTVFA
jgi:hypothetical protein